MEKQENYKIYRGRLGQIEYIEHLEYHLDKCKRENNDLNLQLEKCKKSKDTQSLECSEIKKLCSNITLFKELNKLDNEDDIKIKLDILQNFRD
jgi:hypothetical protein